MQANVLTIARLGTALELAGNITGLAGGAAAVPTHEPTEGADGGSVLPDLNRS